MKAFKKSQTNQLMTRKRLNYLTKSSAILNKFAMKNLSMNGLNY